MHRLLPALALLGALACKRAEAPPALDPISVRRAIEFLNTRQSSALLKGDSTLAAANYAADAIVMLPGLPAVRGAGAITSLFGGMLAGATVSQMALDTREVVVSGDFAVEDGRYRQTITPKGGQAVTDSGKHVVVWRHEPDGSWKIIRDILNTDIPGKP
jgi:uncharacterized protein (TIGR02246 family)